MKLFDTHTHFDEPEFDADRLTLAQAAKAAGVEALVLVGYVEQHFERLLQVQAELEAARKSNCATTAQAHTELPKTFAALGLHPAYVHKHERSHLGELEGLLPHCLALGEIGLDTFTDSLKAQLPKQREFFAAQLELAAQHNKPVLLHIRKAHADVLHMLKSIKNAGARGQFTGVAHSFSGGEQEAKAFVDLGFKLGVTTQITNPGAKKLQRAVRAVGARHLVVETDCPDMMPFHLHEAGGTNRNTPENLLHGLRSLAEVLSMDAQDLSETLWQNSLEALCLRPDLTPKH